jgi:hypothetical protein
MLSKTTARGCALLLAASLGVSACEGKQGTHQGKLQGFDEPAREGLAIPLGGLEYNVFITRELNLRIPPDKAYYDGPAPPKGETLYGVFIQVCNKGDKPRPSAEHFKVLDNQHNEFEPVELPPDNSFAYHPRTLDPGKCIPEEGSVAELGPTEGALLLFKLPLEVTENRPLELEIEKPPGEGGKHHKLAYELDL